MKEAAKKSRFMVWYHLGLLAFSALATLVIKYRQGDMFHPTVVVTFFSIFFMSVFIGYLAIFLVKRYEKYPPVQLTRKIIPALLVFYAGSYIIAQLVVSLGVLGWFVYSGRDLSEFFPHLFSSELNFASARIFLWLMLFTLVFFFFLWQNAVKREQALIREKLQYRYNNLKARVNPHFLFNSLNTLSELVYLDREKAERFIRKLSSVYRYVLENENSEFVSLEKELRFVREYLELQKERDQGKVFLDVRVNDPENRKVIPVSLQILVENALKHNAASKNRPLIIKIVQERNEVIVSNNLQRKESLAGSTGTGLENLKERVKLATGGEVQVEETGGEFRVSLPLIPENHESADH
ncbi:MAG TPA: hypothetical protein ENF21_06110 [Bacteroidetes bacterium]|nr:hypothetical protein [Bacteroidota bacterium]